MRRRTPLVPDVRQLLSEVTPVRDIGWLIDELVADRERLENVLTISRDLASWFLQPLVAIPAGAKPQICFGCNATIYFAPSVNRGRPTPVSLKDPRAIAPTEDRAGQGINHFIDCPRGSEYRVNRSAPASIRGGQ